MNIRCVVTGQNESGKAVFVRDWPAEPITVSLLPGFEFHRLWGSDSVQKLPSAGNARLPGRYFPPTGGFRFGLFTIPPETHEGAHAGDVFATFAELQQKLPGMAEVLEPGNPGMHTTDTVDFDVIVSGEVYLELDDGAEVLLKAGDCVVQNGTRHAWRNRSPQNCVIAVTLVGAERIGH
ncbi:MAG TPA: cupin domain-containing protein [Bryobacteraceae bacterium]|nr:cupin domain-containing protein [Bryobacteraceae bacterium]